MSTPGVALPTRASWYAEGARWIASSLAWTANRLGRAAATHASLDPMPRHTSFDEVVGDLRNRIHSGFGGGQRPYY